MKAYLMYRYENPRRGTTEWWDTEDDKAIYVYFNMNIRETMAFPYDLTTSDRVTSWEEIGVWHKDMTGGKAIRDMGYEPVEEAEHEER